MLDRWNAYQAVQQAAAVLLAVVGVMLALGWLLLPRCLPARWVPAARWVYTLVLVGLLGWALVILKG